MAEAKRCDRCDKFYINNRIGRRTATNGKVCFVLTPHDVIANSLCLDLCDDCLKDLEQFLTKTTRDVNKVADDAK